MSGPRILVAGFVAAGVVLASAGCGARQPASASPGTRPAAVDAPAAVRRGPPVVTFTVGRRQLSINRGGNRPLATVVWYPMEGEAVAAGRFPVMLLSHGLMGQPEQLGAFGTRLAAAGFVAVAPAYPNTRGGSGHFDRGDVPNQPLDATHVITEVLALDQRAGDPLAGHLDAARVGAGGFSAGGYTTAGMLSGAKRDGRLRAAVIIAGGAMGTFVGPATPVLCVHGDADEIVKYSTGRAAYDRIGWSKAFVTVLGKGHGSFLTPGNAGFEQVFGAVLEFLRWALYDDAAARDRIPGAASKPGVTRFEGAL